MKCLSYKIPKYLSSCWLILLLTVTRGTRSDGERTERAPCFYAQQSRADVNFAFKRVNKKRQRTFLDGELYKKCFKTFTQIHNLTPSCRYLMKMSIEKLQRVIRLSR